MSTISIFVCCFAAISPAGASSPDEAQSARRFVQDFYRWYLPRASGTGHPSVDLVLKVKASSLSRELAKALKEDGEEKERNPGYLVGLDFDPFVNNQDPYPGFKVGEPLLKREHYWMEIRGVGSPPGETSVAPDLTVEVARQDGRWVFVNFHYPPVGKAAATDLLDLLQRYKADSEKEHR